MIPKIIHYCWLSENKIPFNIRRLMDSVTQVMPDYKIEMWNAHNFDISSIPFVEQAYKMQSWAFASDVIRLWAVYEKGGIYLDTDVLAKKRFDPFLDNGFFTGMEYYPKTIAAQNSLSLLNKDAIPTQPDLFIPGIGLQAAIFGGEKGHPLLKRMIDWYSDRQFILPDGSLNNKILAPTAFAKVAEEFGFRYINTDQQLTDDIQIYNSKVFAANRKLTTHQSYAVHYCVGSWRSKNKNLIKRKLINPIKHFIRDWFIR